MRLYSNERIAAIEDRGEAGGVAKAKEARTAKSPYMSLLAYTRDRKASLIPAVVHMDG